MSIAFYWTSKRYLSYHSQLIISFIHSIFIDYKIDLRHYAENYRKLKIDINPPF